MLYKITGKECWKQFMAKTVKIGPYSAYAIAVAAGYQGTEQEWLASLVGPQGAQGASVTGAQIDENGHLILTVHDPKTGTDTQINAGSIDTTNAAQAVLAQIQQAGQDAVGSVSESVQQAANSASAAAQSATEAQGSAASAKQDADNATASAAVVTENAQNLQNVTDNLAAIQGAASNAQAAAQSAAEAAQSAQQALGFRTFFSAVSPDENGDLDPSRPMTTSAAQASWTVKSKGDRIQNVRVNGFTQDGVSGGSRLVQYVITGKENWVHYSTNTKKKRFVLTIEISAIGNSAVFSTFYLSGTTTSTYNEIPGLAVNQTQLYIYDAEYSDKTIEEWKQHLQDLYNVGTPVTVWYYPSDSAQATGLYIPIQAQGHKYRCQCLPLTEALVSGDNVQSNVPSGCDKSITLNGSRSETWVQNGANGAYQLSNQTFPATESNSVLADILSSYLAVKSASGVYGGSVGISINTSGKLSLKLPDGASPTEYLPGHPLSVWYRSEDYKEHSDIPVELETHANGAVYAHQAVELAAVPYTEADVAAAQQLANTPSTLPAIDNPDVPMLLDAADNMDSADVQVMALAANAVPVAGTYVVSSQDNTTVQVTLKAMQNGGDAATLDGHTWADIQKLISDAVASAVALSQ